MACCDELYCGCFFCSSCNTIQPFHAGALMKTADSRIYMLVMLCLVLQICTHNFDFSCVPVCLKHYSSLLLISQNRIFESLNYDKLQPPHSRFLITSKISSIFFYVRQDVLSIQNKLFPAGEIFLVDP